MKQQGIERKKVLNVYSKNSRVLSLVLLMTACTHQQIEIPVSERTHPEVVSQGWHVVQSGDTLFSIAWRYGQDYSALADANKIAPPYLIRPGRKLSLSVRSALLDPPLAHSVLPEKKHIGKAISGKVYRKSTSSITKKKSEGSQVLKWHWPVSGKVISRFSAEGGVNKGIDIDGDIGEPVSVAAAGEVVYAGSGLTGYGNLIIVKHNDSYLSAYAHNKALFVKEGDVVIVGQKIAEIGSTGTSEPKLHFEIRRNGKPVDPLLYLSKR